MLSAQFLEQHEEILLQGLAVSRIVHQPYLEWVEGNAYPAERAIQPDFLAERADGNFDIYDLKLPLLDKRVTKGQRRRRRFVDYVEEGVAQLAHYRDYFSFEGNRNHAFDKFGIRIDDPKSVLIVGNQENVDREKIEEACRRLKQFELMDYDTLLRLYVAANVV